MRPCALVALVPKAPLPSEWLELPRLAALTDGNQVQIALSDEFPCDQAKSSKFTSSVCSTL